jgi:hypothetical protein
MGTSDTYINFFYGLVAIALLTGSFWIKPKSNGWVFFMLIIILFLIAGMVSHSFLLSVSALFSSLISIFRYRRDRNKNRTLDVIFVQDHEDQYLRYFLDYYRHDIAKFFPTFDFKIEEEYLVVIILLKMETIGLIIAEIRNHETLRICIDYMVPKHQGSRLAKTFYNCQLRCIDFLDYKYLYIEPQSKIHNDYLERIGFRLVDGKYVNQCSEK